MNRDSANRLTISSPLEAHKNECLIFSICGVDVGFDNPVFAMIELEYTEADQDPTGEAASETEKKLTYYELDLGLNHVVRRWSEPISRTANFLLTVPGGDDGPSGVLICGENWVSYKHQGHVEIRAPLPRRADMPQERGLLIVSGTVFRQKGFFFFLIQTELGDLYTVTLKIDEADKKIVNDVVVTVLDSIPTANSICITKSGLLFAASEFGNHGFYQFLKIGDDPSAIKASRILDDELNEELGDDSISACRVAPLFQPSSRLQNLELLDDIPSLAPITEVIIDDFAGEESPQIVSLCGRGHRSSMRVMRHGVSVTEMAVSDLPSKPNALWTLKQAQGDDFDHYIVVSLATSTLVLSIGETVEEVTDSGFRLDTPTLQVVLLEDNALLQVTPTAICHIRPDKVMTRWETPGTRIIEKSAVNSRQVAISLAGGEIICFEMDQAGKLMEVGTLDLGKEVCSLDIGTVPPGRVRSSFLSVGCSDETVQILSLDPADMLTERCSLVLSARPESLCLIEMVKDKGGGSSTSGDVSAAPSLYLNVGLSTGVLVRAAVDPSTGMLTDNRQRFLGSRGIRLFRVQVRGQSAVLALSTRAWLMYNYQGRYFQAPVTYDALEYASSFRSEQCLEGIVAVAGSTLRIVTVDNLGEHFNQTVTPLRYTPRKACRVPGTRQMVVIESDHNEYNEAERAHLSARAKAAGGGESGEAMAVVSGKAARGGEDGEGEGEEEEKEEEDAVEFPLRGPLPPVEGKWASCIRVIEPGTGTSLEVLELSNNEAAFSVCTCRFKQHSDETFVVVGVAKDMSLHPRRISAAAVKLFRLLDGRLHLLHQTEFDEVPTCMCEFQGQLLVGCGRSLRLYDLGKKKLLKKCENKLFPSVITRLQCSGDRIYVGDLTDSVHFVKYRRTENTFSIFADDTSPRYVCLSIQYD